jgi:hypothetical protein
VIDEKEKLELVKLKAEIATLAICTWTYKWDPLLLRRTSYNYSMESLR